MWQELEAQSSLFPCHLPSGILFKQPQVPVTNPFWGHLTDAGPLCHPSGLPALLVLFLLAVKSSVYGPYMIPVSDSQDDGAGFQNMSM